LFSAETETNSQIFGSAYMEIVLKRQTMGKHKRPFNGYTNVIQTMNPS